MTAVGIADCSDLSKLVLDGPCADLRRLAAELADVAPAPGGAVLSERSWWCAPSSRRLIVLSPPTVGGWLHARLIDRLSAGTAISVADRSADWAAFAVLGHRAPHILATLGVYGESGDPRSAAPVAVRSVAGADTLWLLESDRKAVALTRRACAARIWQTIERAGRPFAICAVGNEAVARYALVCRSGDAV